VYVSAYVCVRVCACLRVCVCGENMQCSVQLRRSSRCLQCLQRLKQLGYPEIPTTFVNGHAHHFLKQGWLLVVWMVTRLDVLKCIS